MFRVFISHSSKDNELVKKIIARFKEYNLPLWADVKEIHDDDFKITDTIKNALQNSTHFLLVWSKNAKNALYVRDEINWVNENQVKNNISKRILKIDDAGDIPTQFDDPFFHSITNEIEFDCELEKIINAIRGSFELQIKRFKKQVVCDFENFSNDPSSNYDPIIKNFKRFDCYNLYVQQSFHYDPQKITDPITETIDQHVLNLLKYNDEKFLIPVVGDYGSGKSALSHFVLYSLCNENYDWYDESQIVIFVPLGDLPKHQDDENHLVDDIYEYVIKQYEFIISKHEFTNYIERGDITFILDALDEMSDKLDYTIAQKNLDHILNLVDNKNKVLLTSRFTYISDNMKIQLIHYKELLVIEDLSTNQVEEFLVKKMGRDDPRIPKVKDAINSANIVSISSKPLFLNAICVNYEALKKHFFVNESIIFRVVTEEWIKHDVKRKYPSTKYSSDEQESIVAQRERISELLALEEYRRGPPIHVNDIISKVQAEFQFEKASAKNVLDRYYHDAQNSTFLTREQGDKFRFIVQPLVEYFVAKIFSDTVKSVDSETPLIQLSQLIKTNETLDFIRGIFDIEWAIKPHIFNDGAVKQIANFQILKNYEDRSHYILKIIYEHGHSNNVSNLVKILYLTKKLPLFPDLRNLCLARADFSGMDLRGANFSRSDLHGSNFQGANLSGSILDSANLSSANLQNCNLRGVDLNNTNLHGTDLRNVVNLPITEHRARLRGAIL